MSAKASGSHPEVLSCISEECTGCETELKRTKLHALLCKHKEEQASEGGRFFGEKGEQ